MQCCEVLLGYLLRMMLTANFNLTEDVTNVVLSMCACVYSHVLIFLYCNYYHHNCELPFYCYVFARYFICCSVGFHHCLAVSEQ